MNKKKQYFTDIWALCFGDILFLLLNVQIFLGAKAPLQIAGASESVSQWVSHKKVLE